MRRSTLIALLLVLTLTTVGLAGCGGDEVVSPTAETVVGTLPETTTEESPGADLEGDAAAGEAVYAENGCGGCHALEAAGSSGNIGPNLDDSQPELELVIDRVTNGAGAMPAFGDQLEPQEIADVAAYVVESTQG